jgi:hypothetical protein
MSDQPQRIALTTYPRRARPRGTSTSNTRVPELLHPQSDDALALNNQKQLRTGCCIRPPLPVRPTNPEPTSGLRSDPADRATRARRLPLRLRDQPRRRHSTTLLVWTSYKREPKNEVGRRVGIGVAEVEANEPDSVSVRLPVRGSRSAIALTSRVARNSGPTAGRPEHQRHDDRRRPRNHWRGRRHPRMSVTVGVVVSTSWDEVVETGERDGPEALHARCNLRRRHSS